MQTLLRILIFVLCVWAGMAAAQEAPEALVKRAVLGVTQALQADTAMRSGSRMRLNALVDEKILPYVDMERITRAAAGRHWAGATPEQRQALTREFKTLLTNNYAGAFSSYRDDTLIEYRPAREPLADGRAEVRSLIKQGSKQTAQLDYVLEKINGAWKVTDFNVQGVWVVDIYRNQFEQVINAGGVDALIRALSTKNREIESRERT